MLQLHCEVTYELSCKKSLRIYMSNSPEMLEEDPLLPLLPLAARAAATLLSWSTWIVLGRGRAVGRPAVLLDRSLGTGRALTGSGIRWPCRVTEDGRYTNIN